jgi:hypothetical protein
MVGTAVGHTPPATWIILLIVGFALALSAFAVWHGKRRAARNVSKLPVQLRRTTSGGQKPDVVADASFAGFVAALRREPGKGFGFAAFLSFFVATWTREGAESALLALAVIFVVIFPCGHLLWKRYGTR